MLVPTSSFAVFLLKIRALLLDFSCRAGLLRPDGRAWVNQIGSADAPEHESLGAGPKLFPGRALPTMSRLPQLRLGSWGDTVPAAVPGPLQLRPGDWVEVRSEAEILATLDGEGTLDGLPFMPEMRRFCGRRFQVKARADRSIAEKVGYLRMVDTVHLDDLRCDGEAHDGCRRACRLFWKEQWLLRSARAHAGPPRPERAVSLPGKTRQSCGDRYFCQATELHRAGTPLRMREVHEHVRALWKEGVSPIDLARSFAICVHDVVQWSFLGADEWTTVSGTCADKKTPSTSLNLRPAERVRVKSRAEILATLDAKGWNRGMEFSREMLHCCGQEFTVAGRVDRLIRDSDGKMWEVKNTVILEGLVYKSLARLLVPRGEYMFWRECWLERVG